MRARSLIATGFLVLAACSGEAEADTASLLIGDTVFELDYYDCSASVNGHDWFASSENPRVRLSGTEHDGSGLLMVDAELPDGTFASYMVIDPMVAVEDGLSIGGTTPDGESWVSASLPCRDMDSGAGTVELPEGRGDLVEVGCSFGPITVGVGAEGSINGRDFMLHMTRQPDLDAGFEDLIEMRWFDTDDELTVRATFPGDPPYTEHDGLFTIGEEYASATGVPLLPRGGGDPVLADIELTCGIMATR